MIEKICYLEERWNGRKGKTVINEIKNSRNPLESSVRKNLILSSAFTEQILSLLRVTLEIAPLCLVTYQFPGYLTNRVQCQRSTLTLVSSILWIIAMQSLTHMQIILIGVANYCNNEHRASKNSKGDEMFGIPFQILFAVIYELSWRCPAILNILITVCMNLIATNQKKFCCSYVSRCSPIKLLISVWLCWLNEPWLE